MGKSDKIIDNIVKGKLEKYYSENVLLEQLYILDEEKKVKQILDEFIKEKEQPFKVNSFIRVSL
jgi:elongation factor Ts